MASFSVDITEVVFAGAHSGYKDITITGMPQAGVSCTITGTDTSAFNYRIPGDDQNVYRVYTTGLTTDSYTPYNAVFKITNSSDSSDYVEVQLHQLRSGYYDLEGNHSGCVVNVVCDSPMFINIPKDWHNTEADYTSVYANQNNGGDSTAHCTVLLDSVWTIPTSSVPSWIVLTQEVYTDTGFKKVYVSVKNNSNGPRKYMLDFYNSDHYLDYVWVYQDGYPSSTSGCTATLTFPKSGGTLTATVKHPSSSNNDLILADTGALYNIYREGYSAVKDSSSTNSSVFSITIPANTSDGEIRSFVYYQDLSGSTSKYLGHTTIIQEGNVPTPTLTVDPSVLTYPSTGGGRVLDVTYATSLSTNVSSFPSWLGATYVSTRQGSGSYTITAASNTSTASRSFDFNLADVNMSLTVPITQDAGSSSSSISVSPSSLSFGPDASYADISLTYGGTHFNTAADEVYTWVTVNMSDKGGGQATGTVSVPVNNTTASRKGNIYFTDEEGGSIALPVEQSGIQAVLSANPSSLNIPAEGGTVTTAVTYVGSLSAASLPSWLSETHTDNDANHRTYTVTAASNGPTQERTFNWRLDDDYNNMYVFISQAAKIQSSLVISPTSKSVGEAAGTVEITVRSTNISDISYNISGDWIKYKSKSGSVYTFSYYQNDTMSVRQGSITFSGGGISRTFTLTQEESGISASPSSLTFSAAAGQSKTVVVTYEDSLHIVDDTPDWIRVAYDISGSPRNYYFTTELDNTSIYSKQWDVIFYNDKSRLRVPIIQKGKDSVYLTVSPSSSSVSSESGTMYVSVAARGIKESDINVNVDASWVTRAGNSNFNFYFDYTANTGPIERIAKITFSALGKTATYTLTQRSSQGETMKVTPTELNYTAAGGTKSVTVSGGNGTINVNNGSFPSWLSIKSAGGGVYNLTTTKNTGKARSFTVWFTDNTSTVTMNVYQQAGDTPGPGPTPVVTGSLKAYPKKLRYYSDGGSIAVSFTNRPTAGIGYTITYTDGSGWLSVKNASPDMYVSATANDGIRRRAEIRFYDLNDSTNYVIVPVIQGSVNYYNSIWMDDLYYPKDRDSSGNYFYRVVNRNSGYPYFTGVSSKPLSWSGDIGGIDVPRLVDKYIRSYYEYQRDGEDWANMYLGCSTVDIYNMTENGYPGVVDATFKYWNDWSRFERRYDYTRSLNDPINCKGCNNMIIPFCVYYDDAATFSVVDTEKNGNVNTYTFSAPSTSRSPFAMRRDSYYDSVRLDYKQDNEVIFSYDMTHCGPGAFIYRNRFGGWDSFLLEGNISKTDNYTKQNYRIKGEYNQNYWINSYKYIDEKRTDSIDIDTTYEAYTGWLTDEESERLVFHLLSSPIVYFQNLHKENQVFDTDPKMGMMPIRITASSAEYKKFRNGKRLVNYLITFEKCNIEKVRQ